MHPTSDQISSATKTGSIDDITQALQYIVGHIDTYSADKRIYSEATLQSLLDAGNVVIACRGWYTDNGESNLGHAYLIYDYSNDGQFKLYDPWNGELSRPYSWICNGRSSTETYDTGVWDGVVTFRIGDYQNTIAWPGVP